MFKILKNKFNLLKRCCRYAKKLNQISYILDKYDTKTASKDCKQLINEIDIIL